MNEIGAQLLYEQHPSVKGVYADLSSGVPEYYATCPECGNVHGMFSSVQDAVNNKVCGGCRFRRIHDFKSDLEKVNDRPKRPKPGQKRKLSWPLSVKEALPDLVPDDLVPEPSADLDSDELVDMIQISWVEKATNELARNNGLDPEDNVVITDADYDEDDPDSSTKVEVEVGGTEYTLYKDEDEITEEVVKSLIQQIWDEPENFAPWMTKQHIDTDKLRRVINSGMDENDIIEDPWDWLEGIYGDEREVIKQAAKMVNIDADAMARECIRYDGWQHFHGRGEDVVELSNGVVAVPF